MSSTQKNCISCKETFLVINQEKEFLKEKGIPLPEECPSCRQKRRESLRTERNLYNYNCDNCQKDIIIAFKPPKDQKVFCKECYLSYYEGFDPAKD